MSRANLTTREVIDGIFAAAATGDLEAVMGWWAADGVLEDITIAQGLSRARRDPQLPRHVLPGAA